MSRLRGLVGAAARRVRTSTTVHQQTACDDVVSQKLLMEAYAAAPQSARRSFRDVGFGIYSQHDEDGILLYIFALIGAQTRRSVEICAGDGIECNTANLLINHRWTGLLVDGSDSNVQRARAFYRSRKETLYWPPDIRQAWVTRENVNELVAEAGFEGDIDLLSLDIDGIDYWLWEALTVVSPRVVVLEYNHLLGPEVSMTVPYRADFVADFSSHGSDYAGASLGAFIKLGRRKGYRFVGTNSIGTNAFFVQEAIPQDILPEENPANAFSHPRAQYGTRVRYESIRDKPWVEV